MKQSRDLKTGRTHARTHEQRVEAYKRAKEKEREVALAYLVRTRNIDIAEALGLAPPTPFIQSERSEDDGTE